MSSENLEDQMLGNLFFVFPLIALLGVAGWRYAVSSSKLSPVTVKVQQFGERHWKVLLIVAIILVIISGLGEIGL